MPFGTIIAEAYTDAKTLGISLGLRRNVILVLILEILSPETQCWLDGLPLLLRQTRSKNY